MRVGRRISRRSWAGILSALALLTASPVQAGEGRGAVLILGDAAGGDVVGAMDQGLPWGDVTAISDADRLDPADPAFTHSLAVAVIAAEAAAEARADERCQDPVGSFAAHLEEARRLVRLQRLGDAEAALGRAEIAFACGEEAVERGDLWEMLFLEGVARIYGRSGSPFTIFGEAFLVDPGHEVPKEYDLKIQDIYSKARAYARQSPPVAVVQPGDELSPLTVLLDGAPTGEGYALLIPGTHRLQLVEPDGRAIRGVDLYVSHHAGNPPPLLPEARRPADGAEVVAALEASVAEGELTGLQAAAVDDLTRWAGDPWTLLAAPVELGTGAKVIAVLPGEDPRMHYIRVAAAAPPPAVERRRRRASPALTVAFGSVAVLAAGGYGYLYYDLTTRPPLDYTAYATFAEADAAYQAELEEIEGLRRPAAILRATAVGAGAVAGVMGIVWIAGRDRGPEQQISLNLGAAPGIAWTVRW